MEKFFTFVGIVTCVHYAVRLFYLALSCWQCKGRLAMRKHLYWATVDQAVGDKPLHWWQRLFRWLNL